MYKEYRDNMIYNLESEWYKSQKQIMGMCHLDKLLFGEIQEQFSGKKTSLAMRGLLRKGLSDAARRDIINSLGFIPTATVKNVFEILNRSRKEPVLSNLRVTGEARTGKTWAMKYFTIVSNLEKGNKSFVGPVLFLEVPPGSTLTPLLQSGCALLGYPIKGKYPELEERFIKAVRQNNVEMIILDEAGSIHTFLKRSQLKHLYNKLQIPMIAVSAEEHFYGSDNQLAGRFETECRFNPYSKEELQKIVKVVETYLPFEETSWLSCDKIRENGEEIPGPMQYIFDYSKGRIGKALDIIREAARIALDQQATHISVKHILAAKDIFGLKVA